MSTEILNKDETFYIAATEMCMANIKNGKSGEEAIQITLDVFASLVNNIDNLREYLYKNISFEADIRPAILYGEGIKDREWWSKYKSNIDNKLIYWKRYRHYLQEYKKWSLVTIGRSIETPTDYIMNAIANPRSGLSEKCYGLVFGYVQSGKTANYIGLINKAVDAGYKIIIVLAGMHNNLRSQTQTRIDEEVLGFETSIEYLKKINNADLNSLSKIGVGRVDMKVDVHVEPLTSRDEKGDFNRQRASVSRTFDNPKIFIVKKQKSVLENIYNNFRSNHSLSVNSSGNRVFSCEYPLLVIDDEADQASVNTKYKADNNGGVVPDADMSKINEMIRKILSLFECRSYVGYTATPYANIFIPPHEDNHDVGADLFPEDFIICLPKPEGYIGAMEFFGEDENSTIMPLHRTVKTDLDSVIDIKSKSLIGRIPELRTAILSFLISTAVRNLRGFTEEPNSMLIHINRLTDIHSELTERVKDDYSNIESYLSGGDSAIIEELADLWYEDYVPTTAKMKTDFSSYMQGVSDVDFCDVLAEIRRIADTHSIKIMEINGKSDDVLCYKKYKDEKRQLNVIAIGGDKLSRGLTLEGLTVSFFLRSSTMYDTLMQMGRWFGFRPKYADLCRLYVSDVLFRNFMVVSYATEDLRDQVNYMVDHDKSPKDFGLRVSSDPELYITSLNKLKTGQECILSFSNTTSQTRSIEVDADSYNINFDAADYLVSSMGLPSLDHRSKLQRKSQTKHIFWDNVSSSLIINFFSSYQTSQHASKVNAKNIADYISQQNKCGNLVDWTVCLKNSGTNSPINIGGQTVGSGLNRSEGQFVFDGDICSIKALKSKDEEYYDFTADQLEQVKKLKESKASDYEIRKQLRDSKHGLLILCPLDSEEITVLKVPGRDHKPPIGFIAVFPDAGVNQTCRSYRLNPIALESGDYVD